MKSSKDLEKRLNAREEKLKDIVSLVDGLTPMSISWERSEMGAPGLREYVEDGVKFKDYLGFDLTYKYIESGGEVAFEYAGKVVLQFRYSKETKPFPNSEMRETFTIIDEVEKYVNGPWERAMSRILAMPNHERMNAFIEPKVKAYEKQQEQARKDKRKVREREQRANELRSRAARLRLS